LPDPILPPGAPQIRRILFASLIGTTIEFFDFYIYATAAVLVFPRLFFPKGDPNTALLQSLATFALAFFARPVGSVLFGHFGDRIGRKATLVTALLTMGISTVCIGLLPTDSWRWAGWDRAWDWAASGAARCCWQRKTRRRAGMRGTAAFRSSARRWDSCVPPAYFC
jgi:MFS family permease